MGRVLLVGGGILVGLLFVTSGFAAQAGDGDVIIEWPTAGVNGDIDIDEVSGDAIVIDFGLTTATEGQPFLLDQKGTEVGRLPVFNARKIAINHTDVWLLAGDEVRHYAGFGSTWVLQNIWPGWPGATDIAVDSEGRANVLFGREVWHVQPSGSTELIATIPDTDEPAAIEFDMHGLLYVATWDSTTSAATIHTYAHTVPVDVVTFEGISEPVTDIAVDATQWPYKVIVAAEFDVWRYTMDGAFDRSVPAGSFGLDRRPGGVAVDRCGTVYTAQTGSPDTDMAVSKVLLAGRNAPCLLDVLPGHTFYTSITWLAEEGITRGCNPPANDHFCDEDTVTRGEMAAFLTRALKLTERADNPFVDDDGSIFEPDIERIAAAGITLGCNPPVNDRFCPDDDVPRDQMAAMLVRAFGYTDDGGGDLFTDDDGSIFESDIDKLATAGVTKGCNPPTNDRYCPKNLVTRGQFAAFLYRAMH